MKRANRLTTKRSERKKVPLKAGAYLIITDAEKTEKNYLIKLYQKLLILQLNKEIKMKDLGIYGLYLIEMKLKILMN